MMSEAENLAAPYASMTEQSEVFAIFARGRVAFRYGPFHGHEAGVIMKRADEIGIPVHITINGGPVLDWDLVTDLYGGAEALAAGKNAEGNGESD